MAEQSQADKDKQQQAEQAAQKQREAQQQDEQERQRRQADEDRARESQARVRSGTGDESPAPGSAEERGQRRVGAVPGGATETEQAVHTAATDPLRLSARTAEAEPQPLILGDTADGNDPQIALKRATEAPRVVYVAPTEEVQPADAPDPRRTREARVEERQAKRDAQQEDTKPVTRS